MDRAADSFEGGTSWQRTAKQKIPSRNSKTVADGQQRQKDEYR